MYHKKKRLNWHSILLKEKSLIEKNYKHLKCIFLKSTLYCYGEFQPTLNSITYSYVIKYAVGSTPSVYVKHPIIQYSDDIHMYPKDNSLCLYHKTDLIWSDKSNLFDTIIPWTHEWFIFYELYQLTGKWLHPEIKHVLSKKNK